jgi:hypothetical protein
MPICRAPSPYLQMQAQQHRTSQLQHPEVRRAVEVQLGQVRQLKRQDLEWSYSWSYRGGYGTSQVLEPDERSMATRP